MNVFKGRINRRSYLIGWLVYSFLLFVGFMLYVPVGQYINSNMPNLQPLGVIYLVSSIVIYYLLVLGLTAKRFHDLGRSGWSSLWLFVGNIFLIIGLSLMVSEDKSNKYGSIPSAKLKFL